MVGFSCVFNYVNIGLVFLNIVRDSIDDLTALRTGNSGTVVHCEHRFARCGRSNVSAIHNRCHIGWYVFTHGE